MFSEPDTNVGNRPAPDFPWEQTMLVLDVRLVRSGALEREGRCHCARASFYRQVSADNDRPVGYD